MTTALPLGLLEVSGLIRPSGSSAGDEYMFRHTLMQETVYGTLLRGERSDLHRAVGRAIQRAYSNGAEELASVLAEHFLKGNEPTEAVTYFKAAGDQAARVHATAEAMEHYGQALSLAKQGFGEAGDVEYLYERRGRMFELSGRYEEALENYRECEEFGREISDVRLELRGMVRRGNLYCFPNPVMNPVKGEALALETLERAREVGDRETECLALWNLMKKSEFAEEYQQAAEVGRQALDLAEELGLDSQRAFIMNDLSGIYLSTANLEESWRLNQQAKALWQELDNLPMLTDSLGNEIVIHMFRGDYDKALEVSHQGTQLSEKINNLWGQSYNRYFVYWVYFERGQIDQAFETARRCVEFGEQAGFVVPSVQTIAEIALMHAYMGEQELARERQKEAVHNAEKYFPEWNAAILALNMLGEVWSGRMDRAGEILSEIQRQGKPDRGQFVSYLEFTQALSIPETLLAQGKPEPAMRQAKASIEAMKRQGAIFTRADLQLLYGRALRELGRQEEARQALEEGRRLAEKIGSRRVEWRILAVLAGLAEEEGRSTEAERLVDRALELVDFIAEHSESPAQRESFLSQDHVRALFSMRNDAD